MIGFTSGAFAGSVAQANYSAAKGGIVSLVRSAARRACTSTASPPTCIAPVAKSRMSGNVPFELEMGEPEDVAPMVVFLLGPTRPRRDRPGLHGQRRAASRCGTSRSRCARWTRTAAGRPRRSPQRFDEVGQERMAMIDRLDAMAKAAAEKKESG